MLLNLFKKYHYFVSYSVVTPEAEKSSQLAEDSVNKLKELRDKKQYQKYLKTLTTESPSTGNLNFLNPKIHEYIRKYFKRRRLDISYFEPCAGTTPLITYAVYGTAGIKDGKLNRNVLIFLLELFAHIKDPEHYKVTQDFEPKKITIDNIEATIYKIHKTKHYGNK